MGSYIFSDMSWLKFASATRASLPIMPSSEIMNREKNPLLVAVLIVLILISFLPLTQKHFRFIKPVGICISVAKFDVDYCVGLSVS